MKKDFQWSGKDRRCVHLDFHTSELIEGIGERFDRKEFAETLKKTGLDSITVFAKCHHGCFYYKDSKFFPHPHLTCDLLDEQLAACKEAGVSAKIYISAGYDEHVAKEHPEWLGIYKKGQPQPNTGFRRICFNTPYLDLLKEHTKEVVEKYKPDGVFFDIVANWPCYCEHCLADMKKKGMDIESEEDLWEQSRQVMNHYFDEMEKTVHSISPNTVIFQNSGGFEIGARSKIDCCEQLELESLPTGGWGYDHFPMMMSYIRRAGKNCIGMTGKFHREWGEFGGYKYKEALRYEAALNLTFGAGMSVGDQMHPAGKLDAYTYEMIGETMQFMKEREAFVGGKYLPELAMFTPQEGSGRVGASRILFEEKYLFDVIDEYEIENGYPLIVVAQDIELSESVISSLKAHVLKGGKILAVGKGAKSLQENGVDLGFKDMEEDVLTPAYFVANYPMKAAENTPLVIYGKVYNMQATGEVLADKLSPYFKREGERFCSHKQTPCDYAKVSPAITQGKDGIAVGADLFALYNTDGGMTAKVLLAPLVEKLLGKKRITTTLPATGKISLYDKGDSLVMHLCYANIIARGRTEVIEDIVTLSSVVVALKAEKPSKVILQPQNEELPFLYEDGEVCFEIKDFNCYAAVELIK
ncbi:MAG: alpha-L-fucosidase [Clostridia bacterium]|nr:alpha-L-fucosidase [Clostridia bacterium]